MLGRLPDLLDRVDDLVEGVVEADEGLLESVDDLAVVALVLAAIGLHVDVAVDDGLSQLTCIAINVLTAP